MQADVVTVDAIDWWTTYHAETPEFPEAAKNILSNLLVAPLTRETGVHTSTPIFLMLN